MTDMGRGDGVGSGLGFILYARVQDKVSDTHQRKAQGCESSVWQAVAPNSGSRWPVHLHIKPTFFPCKWPWVYPTQQFNSIQISVCLPLT